MPIRFEYLYRCAGNYKQWGEVFLSNPKDRPVEELESDIRAKLIDGEFFIAEQIGVPTLYFEETDPELDHGWHEFWDLKVVEQTPAGATGASVEEVLLRLSHMKQEVDV